MTWAFVDIWWAASRYRQNPAWPLPAKIAVAAETSKIILLVAGVLFADTGQEVPKYSFYLTFILFHVLFFRFSGWETGAPRSDAVVNPEKAEKTGCDAGTTRKVREYGGGRGNDDG